MKSIGNKSYSVSDIVFLVDKKQDILNTNY